MKLSATQKSNDTRLAALLAENCATILKTGFDFKICLRTREVTGPFKKRVPDLSMLYQIFFKNDNKKGTKTH